MIRTTEGEWYSASDLLAWLGCAHRTTLDSQVWSDPALRAYLNAEKSAAVLLQPDGVDGDSFDSPAKARGDMHERAMLASLEAAGRTIVRIDRPTDYSAAAIRERADETRAAMAAGAEVVFQATLLEAPWYGFADFLVRVDGHMSVWGDYAYEVRDTKLARHPSANALIQMAHYGSILEIEQGAPPVDLVVWLGTGEEFGWAYSDVAPYLEELRSRFLAFRASGAVTEPEPVAACEMCRWAGHCAQVWGADDLLNVHRLSRRQRTLLRDAGVSTIPALAAVSDDQRPSGMAASTFERLRTQAAVQTGDEPYSLIRPQPESSGIASIPPADPGDIYFDLEGDPFAAHPTLDYLWAYSDTSGEYHHRWAHSPAEEQEAFDWFMDLLRAKEAAGGDWHVYHYNTYEITSMRRVAGQHPDPAVAERRVAEVDAFVASRFVDLYRAVEVGLRTRDGSTSLKIVEKLAGYDRSVGAAAGAVARADGSIVAYETFVMSSDSAERAEILSGIKAYNTHDVLATHAVHLWLRDLATSLGPEDFEPEADPYVQSDAVRERIDRTHELSVRLLAAAESGAPLPSGLSAESATMLSHIIEWHRAEMVAQYVDLMRLKEWALSGGDSAAEPVESALFEALNGPAEEAVRPRRSPGTELESVLLDVEFVRELGAKSSRKNAAIAREYRCRPGSWKVRAGKTVEQALPVDSEATALSFKIDSADPEKGLFTFSRQVVPNELGPLVINDLVTDEAVWESLMRLGESALSSSPDPVHLLAMDMLDRLPPLPATQMIVPDADAGDRARELAAMMTSGLLPIQGPPGTGKTWVGAHLIADAVRRGSAGGRPAVIAITANSHKVINNLMGEAIDRCADEGVPAVFAHVGGKGKIEDGAGIEFISSSGKVAEWVAGQLAAGNSVVVGATKWAWSRSDTAGIADVLIIDEAGQLTLADSCAVAQCAPVAIALGDPQQLSAPVVAAHDESVNVSLLDHIAQGRNVLPDEIGVFLDVTFRMHPAVCRVVADLAYESALRASPSAAARSISGPSLSAADSVVEIAPGVVWIPVASDHDEVDVTAAVLAQLVGSATVTLDDGSVELLDWDEVRVVAPHNAHVNRLDQALPDEAQVGTVDRFQGQQGHVVVYSMGRTAESPGDVPFLYELNRLNVALSRARLLAVVISHEDAVFPPVANPEHLRLASRFIRAVRE